MQELNSIGDAYANEERNACRFYFSYWPADSLSIQSLESFTRMTFSTPKISESAYEEYRSLIAEDSENITQ